MQIVEVPDSEMSRREGQANRITAHGEQHPREIHDILTDTPPQKPRPPPPLPRQQSTAQEIYYTIFIEVAACLLFIGKQQ
jgi:hypothetical protein